MPPTPRLLEGNRDMLRSPRRGVPFKSLRVVDWAFREVRNQ